MKKSVFFLIITISCMFGFSSCQEENESFIYKPTEVVEPPEALTWNRSQAYVTAEDVLNVEYVSTYNNQTVRYYNEEDEAMVVYTNTSIDIYKIKAHRYYGWFESVEYVSSFRETYQITAQVLSQVRERVKEMGFAICWRHFPDDESNYLGFEEIYSVKW